MLRSIKFYLKCSQNRRAFEDYLFVSIEKHKLSEKLFLSNSRQRIIHSHLCKKIKLVQQGVEYFRKKKVYLIFNNIYLFIYFISRLYIFKIRLFIIRIFFLQ